MVTKPTIRSMFPQGEDLPLFSGTAPRAQVQEFKPAEATQARLPGLDQAPDWQEMVQNQHRIKARPRGGYGKAPCRRRR